VSEKTEKPTAHRLREARRKGQIARSRLFNSAAVTAGGLVGLVFGLSASAPKLKTWTEQMLSTPSITPAQALSQAGVLLAVMAAPPLVGALLASLTVSMATAGLHVNIGHVGPQLERVDPFKGFGRLFSAQQLLELGKGLLVATAIGWLVWCGARDAGAALGTAPQQSGEVAMLGLLATLKPIVLRAVALLFVLGLADYALAWRRHRRELMMTREELKQEYKGQEGDPKHKAKRRALHQQISAGGPARGLQKATAVVVNPTHIAVALRYEETECEAPYIVAKGREEDALKLRKLAEALGIPVVRDIPLARTLVHYDVGEEVPEELYQAAAAILKVALEKKNRPAGETP
jgi:type III secretion protein U